MRNRINLILCLIILLFFKGTSLFGQKIIEYKGDTMIVISPHNVMTMNSIIVERNYLEKEVFLLDSLNTLKDSTILEQKQIIKMNEESLLKTNEKNKDNSSDEIFKKLMNENISLKKEILNEHSQKEKMDEIINLQIQQINEQKIEIEEMKKMYNLLSNPITNQTNSNNLL